MYTGSMVGAGFGPYAVMGYVIANQKQDSEVGFQVELNPVLLSTVFGEEESVIEAAIEFLCSPDPKSRTPSEEGRRLVRLGQYAYRVVNGVLYEQIRNEEQRRKQNRDAQARFRAKPKVNGGVKIKVTGKKKGFEQAVKDAHTDGPKIGRMVPPPPAPEFAQADPPEEGLPF